MAVLLLALWGVVLSFAETHAFEPVTIQLRWSHQFQFAGYYAAVEKGFFKAEGLEVFLEPALPGQDRVAPVLEGRAQYGVGDSGILKLRADGRPLVVLAQIFQHSPSILVTKRSSGIFSPYELVGKTIMLPKEAISAAAVRAMLLEALGGLDRITILPRSGGDADLITGRVDAMAGYLSNEPFRLKQKGLAVNIIDPRSYGIDFYGDNLFTTEQEILEHPERVERVRRATLQGWAYALEHRDEIIDLILTKYNPHLNHEQLRFEAKVVEQMILADIIPIGDANPRRYARIAESFHRLGMSPSAALPEGFLYGQASGPAVPLTAEERAWLKSHPDIRFVFSNDYQPALIAQEDGSVTGILKDMLDLLNARLGTHFGITVTDLETGRKMARNKDVSGALLMSPAAARRMDLIPTDSTIRMYPTIFGRSGEVASVKGIEDLAGYRCAIVGDMPTIEGLVAPHEDQIPITRVKTVLEGLKLLHEGRVDFFIGFSQQNYMILKNQLLGLGPVLTMTDRPVDGVMGVREDWPQLVGIINKGLASITEGERSAILARWSGYDQTVRPQSVSLSPEQHAWLAKKHTVRVGLSDFPPFILVKKEPQPTGIAIDLLDLIAERTGLQLRYDDFFFPWDQTPETMRRPGGPDLVPWTGIESVNVDNLQVSKPYMQSHLVVITDQHALPVNSMRDLSGLVVSVRGNSPLHQKIRRDYPRTRLALFETETDALNALNLAKADAYVGNLTLASYLISRNGWTNLKVAGDSGLEDQRLSFGIRGDLPELRSIVDKGLDSISEEEFAGILQKHLSVRYEHGIRKTDIVKGLVILGAAFGLVICAGVLWNVLLARKVAERTADLDHSNKRLSAEIIQRTHTEQALRKSRDYLDNLTNSMAEIVVSVRLPERTIEWVNDAVKQLGYEPDECIGRTTEFIYADQDDFIALGKEMAASIAGNKEDIVTEFMFKKKNGDIFPAEITMSFFESRGHLVSVTGIIRDISERKEREKLIDTYQQRLKALASKLTVSEERERRRIATELHDQIGQSLAIARMQLAAVQRKTVDPSVGGILKDVSQTLLSAARETRHLIFDLSSPTIKELGLPAAINDWMAAKMPQHGIAFELIDHSDDAHRLILTDDNAALLYRHVRELLTNVIKHAKANTVAVDMQTTANEILIGVQDNGVGFDATRFPGSVKRSEHYGLFSIEEGMAEMGGRLEIESAPGSGCRAVLRLPVQNEGN
jgi:two-component system sensor histidine kinase EvgS